MGKLSVEVKIGSEVGGRLRSVEPPEVLSEGISRGDWWLRDYWEGMINKAVRSLNGNSGVILAFLSDENRNRVVAQGECVCDVFWAEYRRMVGDFLQTVFTRLGEGGVGEAELGGWWEYWGYLVESEMPSVDEGEIEEIPGQFGGIHTLATFIERRRTGFG